MTDGLYPRNYRILYNFGIGHNFGQTFFFSFRPHTTVDLQGKKYLKTVLELKKSIFSELKI